jgi:hypothetical protein
MQNELTAERIEMAIAYWAEFYQEIGEMQNGLSGGQYELLEEQREPVITALAALRAEKERLNPQPLTLDEMNAIDNEPLYILHVDSISNGAAWHMNGWHVLKAGTCRNHGQSNWCADYGKNELNGNYSKTWLAYRTKPEGSAE